mmetsp:Transcript_21251/g.62798  ORF Transcript_21251/g.62798 Transcript_21251/m.62798 type:complete len:257 (-) Transcript_21251:9-779(-)
MGRVMSILKYGSACMLCRRPARTIARLRTCASTCASGSMPHPGCRGWQFSTRTGASSRSGSETWRRLASRTRARTLTSTLARTHSQVCACGLSRISASVSSRPSMRLIITGRKDGLPWTVCPAQYRPYQQFPCFRLVARYGLSGLVRGATVERIVVVPTVGTITDTIHTSRCTFLLGLSDGTEVAARRVVCAMGPGPMFQAMRSSLPPWAEGLMAVAWRAGVRCGVAEASDRPQQQPPQAIPTAQLSHPLRPCPPK